MQPGPLVAMESLRGIEGMPMAGLRVNWLDTLYANQTLLVLSIDVEMVSVDRTYVPEN